MKGLGGFHLCCDGRNEAAVARLRAGKVRREKPLALMVKDVAAARALCEVSDAAERWLLSPEAPILLLPRLGPESATVLVAPNVAPESTRLGVMLPSTPLHHLLLAAVDAPLVATSGNLSDEPIATDELEAVARLGALADLFLVHDRPIERHTDDSVGWLYGEELQLLRRARGFAPLPVPVATRLPTVLAVGAHLKNVVGLGLGSEVVLSQHVGDLETPEALAAFERVIADLLRLWEAEPVAIAHDLHPDYLSTRWARRAAAGDESEGPLPPAILAAAREGRLRLVGVQHHHAHLASCLAENGAEGPALGVTWDGTGYGTDGTVWGGEFLLGDAAGFERVAHLRPFRLPGGDAAVREPRRSALALLLELFGEAALSRDDLAPVGSFSASERAAPRADGRDRDPQPRHDERRTPLRRRRGARRPPPEGGLRRAGGDGPRGPRRSAASARPIRSRSFPRRHPAGPPSSTGNRSSSRSSRTVRAASRSPFAPPASTTRSWTASPPSRASPARPASPCRAAASRTASSSSERASASPPKASRSSPTASSRRTTAASPSGR